MLALVDRIYVSLTTDSEEGQGMVEYALILVLAVIVVISALSILGPRASSIFNMAGNSLQL